MKQLYPALGLDLLCRLFGKSRQAFYDHANRNTNELLQKAVILDLVNLVRSRLPKTGGLKLMHILQDDFKAHNIRIGRDCFFRLLKENNLLVKSKKRFVKTTMSQHRFKKWPDLTTNLQLIAPQQVWVCDITYLSTQKGFVYLSLVTDAYSRKIIGYHLSQYLKASGCLIALNKAIDTLDRNAKVIHHSDRGIQYCCDEYVNTLQAHCIKISMTQNGSPYDNAIAERVNGILKTELGLDKLFIDYRQAVAFVNLAVDAYNRLRPHMSCENMTPNYAHLHNGPLRKKWKTKRYCKAKSVLL